jgi:hypothetical protein
MEAVLASPMMVSTAVSMADPNGLWGMIKEGMASARALLDAKKDPGAGELIRALIADIETPEGRERAKEGLKAAIDAKSPAEAKAQALAGLARVNGILESKSPGEAPAFKAWLYQVALKVAESTKEGSFLGFGGVAVSDAEKASLDEISQTLGLS